MWRRHPYILVFALGVFFLTFSCASSRNAVYAAGNSADLSSSGAKASGAKASGVNAPSTGTSGASSSNASSGNANTGAGGTSGKPSAASSETGDLSANASEEKPEEAKRVIVRPPLKKVEFPPSSGNDLFAGKTYIAKSLKLEFLDGKKLRTYSYNEKDECWEKEFLASYSFNTPKAKLYIKIDSVYESGEKLSSAKELFNHQWPPVKKKIKRYLSTAKFNSASKKLFLNYSKENVEISSEARFEKLLTFSFKFLDSGKKLELTSTLESQLSEATKTGQVIGSDKAGKVQLAFSNLTVQILGMDPKTNSAPESFYIGNCVFDEDAKKVSAQMFRIFQSENREKTVYESMQEAGIFEATYTVKTEVNKFAQKQRYDVYNALYKFTVISMPDEAPELEHIEIPVYLHVDKFILKKEDNSDS